MILTSLILAGVTITLPMEVKVRGTEMSLGSIAAITGRNAEEVARIEGISLGSAPSPGYSRLLQASRIRMLIGREAPGVAVRVTGYPACRVWPEVVQVDVDRVHAAARAELTKLFAGKDVTFEPSDRLRAISVPAGASTPVLRARLADQEPESGILGVPVQILVDGEVYRTVWTNWSVTVWAKVPVLAGSVRAGDPIRPAMIETRRVRLNAARRRALPGSMLVGAIAARDIEGGDAVTALDVHRPTVIALGDDLFLEVRKGSVVARMAVIARQPGAIGDRVRVEASATGREYMATVVARSMVRIDLGRQN